MLSFFWNEKKKYQNLLNICTDRLNSKKSFLKYKKDAIFWGNTVFDSTVASEY